MHYSSHAFVPHVNSDMSTWLSILMLTGLNSVYTKEKNWKLLLIPGSMYVEHWLHSFYIELVLSTKWGGR